MVALGGAPAAAQEAPPPDPQAAPPAEAAPDPDAEAKKRQARELYEEGRREYDSGRYNLAIEAWSRGYELHPSPDFHFNIAQAYRRKADASQALHYYQAYLREKPNAANRGEVEATIVELEEILARDRPTTPEAAAAPAATPSPSAPDPAAGAPLRTAGLITAGGGAALAVTGVVFLVLASSSEKDLEDAAARHEPWTDALADEETAADRNSTLGAIGLGLGAAAVVTGGVLYYLGWQRGRAPVSASVGATGGAAFLELTF